MTLQFSGPMIYWRGPAPFYFVVIPEAESHAIREVSNLVTYGWGCIPVSARIGGSDFTTALFPKDGAYYLPVKAKVRTKEKVDEGAVIEAQVELSFHK
jgi:hypothetical protein